MPLPSNICDEAALETLLSEPTDAAVDLFRRGIVRGPTVVLGSGGKMGASLVKQACRARQAAGVSADDAPIYSVSRFSDSASRRKQDEAGALTIACDLMNPDAVAQLPDARQVIYMVGLKFGTQDNPSLTWAVNTVAPTHAARRYADATFVVFSTGCVYDLTPTDSGGSVETDSLTPIGEYSNAAVARERVFEHFALSQGTAMSFMRLNYALEPRYGVLVDLATAIQNEQPIDLTMGHFNGIWQRDANAVAWRLLEHARHPPSVFNVTGTQTLSVRDVATRLAERIGKPAHFINTESPTALLSNAARATELFGPPPVPIEQVIDWVADWIARGQRTLGKPTHFQTRDGVY